MNIRVLVTGGKGFIGRHLCNRLMAEGIHFDVLTGDITDFFNVFNQLCNNKYSTIFHLAGLSNVRDSETNPDRAYMTNVVGTFNLLESLKRTFHKTRLVFASTAQVYSIIGDNKDRIIITESFPLGPTNTYAQTKLAAELQIKQYFNQFELGEAVVLRMFNHTHKTQVGPFFFPQIYQQLKETQEVSPKIDVGNLQLLRDFSLVSDLIDLLIACCLKRSGLQKFEVFNVCSGQARELSSLARELSRALNKDAIFVTNSTFMRSNDPLSLIGDSTRCQDTFSWTPKKLSDSEFISNYLKSFY